MLPMLSANLTNIMFIAYFMLFYNGFIVNYSAVQIRYIVTTSICSSSTILTNGIIKKGEIGRDREGVVSRE